MNALILLLMQFIYMQAPKDNKDNIQCSVAKMQLQTSRL